MISEYATFWTLMAGLTIFLIIFTVIVDKITRWASSIYYTSMITPIDPPPKEHIRDVLQKTNDYYGKGWCLHRYTDGAYIISRDDLREPVVRKFYNEDQAINTFMNLEERYSKE